MSRHPQLYRRNNNGWTSWSSCDAPQPKDWDMIIQNDFREFLKLLKDDDVEFVILGGYARRDNDSPSPYRKSQIDRLQAVEFSIPHAGSQ